jgi:hypothetical protein
MASARYPSEEDEEELRVVALEEEEDDGASVHDGNNNEEDAELDDDDADDNSTDDNDDDGDNNDDNDNNDDKDNDVSGTRRTTTTAAARKQQPLKSIDRRHTERLMTAPGTLLHLSEEAKDNNALDGKAAANHINKWAAMLGLANAAFELALQKESRQLTRSPIVLALIEPVSSKIQLVHGFDENTLNNEDHEAEGKAVSSFVTAPRSRSMGLSSNMIRSSAP